MKPNYLVIGAAKCGSTTLSRLLGWHPDIYIAPREIAFFARDERYAEGFSWYENFFASAKGEKRVGEHSNHYTMKDVYPNALERLVDYVNPSSLQLIYIVRHPLELIESFWVEMRSHGSEHIHYDFNVAVKENRNWLLDVANYWQQLSPYRKLFSDEQILVLFLEDLKSHQAEVMAKCYEFLDVDPSVAEDLPNTRLNPSDGKRILSPTKSKLRQIKGSRAAAALIPKPAKQFLINRFFMSKMDARPQWHPEVRRWAIQELAEDTHRFLQYSGKPSDWWPLSFEGL